MFAMIEIYFLGNDDINFQGFKIGQTSSVQATEDRIREVLEEEFEENSYMNIYSSDNDNTPFGSVQEVMDTLTVSEISEEEYKTLSKLLGQDYGHTTQFMLFAE